MNQIVADSDVNENSRRRHFRRMVYFVANPPREPIPYMGGTAYGCGDHPSLPKRHRWGPWRVFVMPNPDYIGRERTCLTCALVDDTQTKLRRKDGKVQW